MNDPKKTAMEIRNTFRILVAEDDEVHQKITRKILENAGYQVLMVENGRDAVKFCELNRVDLIFMDRQMPIEDGLSATKALRKKNFMGPIIALTGGAFPKERDELLEAGSNEVVAKEVSVNTLIAIADQWLLNGSTR